jgi:hypothetical protein
MPILRWPGTEITKDIKAQNVKVKTPKADGRTVFRKPWKPSKEQRRNARTNINSI